MFRFLLRFFAVFIACSAFVGLASRPVFAYQVGGGDSASPTPNCPDPYNGLCGEIGSNESSAPCDENPLTFNTDSHSYGTYTLTAQYVKTPYAAYYERGTCGGEEFHKDNNDAYYQEDYSVLALSDANMSLPGGYAFNGWSACWYDCDNDPTESNCLSSPSVGTLQPGPFDWANDKCLLLVGNCTAQDTYTITYKAGTCGSNPEYVVRTSDPQTVDTQFDARSDTAMAESELAVPAVTNFHGWTESSNPIVENGVLQNEWDDSNPITMTRNIVVYAACTPKTYQVEYKPGTTCAGDDYVDNTATGGQNYSVKDITEVDTISEPENKHFVSWTVCWHEDVSNYVCDDTMSPTGPFTIPKDSSWTFLWNNDAVLTLTANCEEDDSYSVRFKCNNQNETQTIIYEDDDGENLYENSTLSVWNGADNCGTGFTEWSCKDTNGQTVSVTNDVLTMPASDVICDANYEYKVDYYCSETTNVSKKQDTVMHGENYTWWNEPTSSTCSEASTKDFNGWSCTPGGTRSAGAQGTYEWYQDMKCYALWTTKYPVTYDCNNNGLGTDGNGTNPSDSNSPYAAGNAVNVLAYPAGCQAPTERVADATLGWKCVGEDGTEYDNNGFSMPNQPVTCTAQWKSTAKNITYIGCKCSEATNNNDLYYNKCTQDLTSRVKSGEDENNDSSTYYRTYTSSRNNVVFPTHVGVTEYGEINVASEAFSATWFVFNVDPYGEYSQNLVTVSSHAGTGNSDITVYTCLGDSYQVTYNCIKGNGGTQVKGPYQKQYVQTLGSNACPYELGWTFKWNCGGLYTNVDPLGSIYVDSDKVCNADWTCDTGYVSDGNGQCVRKYNLTFDCANGKDSNKSFQLSAGATQGVVSCQPKDCSEPEYTWSCSPSSALSGDTVTMPASNVTCTAQWTPIKYTVTYNSGSCGSAGHTNETLYTHSDGATCGVGYSVPSNATSAMNNVLQSGYTFVGWNINSGQTTSNWSGGNITGDITVYAACKSIEYNLTLRCNDNQTSDRIISYNAGASVPLVSTKRNGCANDTDGMIFSHWTCDPSSLYDNSNVTMNNNVVCDAHWDTKYHLTYDCANDRANEDPTGGWYDSGEAVTTLTDNDQGTCSTLPYEGAEFKGWSCSPSNNRNGSTGAMTMPASNVECTAQWDGAEFTVTYDCSGTTVTGGHVKNSENTQRTHERIKYGSSSFTFDQANNVCEYAHYTPANWTCVREDTEQDITSTISFGVSEKWKRPYNVKCTTDWTPEPVTLTYDCYNDGLGTSSNPGQNPQGGTYDYNTRVAMVEGDGGCKVPATGKTFKGWNCSPDSPDDDGYITLTTDTTCTADWGDAVYHLTYDCNGGTGNPPRDEDENGNLIDRHYMDRVVIKTNNNACQNMGASFVGWLCNNVPVGEGFDYYMPTTDVTCYAQWQTQNYQLKYNCNNNGLGTNPGSQTYAAGTPNIQVLANTNYSTCKKPTSDKNFQGWNCHKEGDTGTLFVSGSAMPAYNVVCDGQWGDPVWSITYIGCRSGNCLNCSDKWILNEYVVAGKQTYGPTTYPHIVFPVPYNSEDQLLVNTIEDEGYYFDGMWMDAIGNGFGSTSGLYNPLTLCTNLKPYYDVTYDCDWDYQAPIDENNPYVSGSKVSVKNSSTCGDGARDGYTFINWSCQPDGQSAFDVAGSGGEFNITADTTCTAVWDGNSYKIIYRGGTAGTRPVTQIAMANQPVQFGEENVKLRGNTYSINGYSFSGWVCEAKIDTSSSVPEEILQNLPEGVSSENITITGTNRTTYTCPDVIAGRSYNIGTYRWISDMVCTAQWTPRNYNIIYNKGSCDGTSYTNYDSLTYDDTYSVLGLDDSNMTVVAPVGYVFTGWRTVDTVIQNPDRIPGQTYGPWTTAGDLNLYATCEREPYHVTYDCDTSDEDSVTPVDEKSYYVDNTVSLKQNTCKKTGWSPLGWDCHPLASETSTKGMSNSLPIYDDNTFSMPADNVKCDMRWEQDVYHVTYECRGDADCDSAGSNCQTPQDDQGYNYGESVTTATNTCTKAGHDFVKWNCAGQDVGAGRDFDIYDNTLCYAVWNPKQYNIKYQSGNCESRDTHVTQIDYSVLTYGQNFTVGDVSDSGVNVRNGYEFLGWSTSLVTDEDLEINSFESEYVSGQTYGPWVTDDDLILHAVCKKKIYNICYDFQVQGAGWKDENANPLYSYDVDTEMGSREVFLAVENNEEGNFYVFDGWYNTPGIYLNQNDTEIEITSVPSTYAEPLDAPVSVKCDETISAQCDESGYAKCDVVLYAKWRDAGKILFDCGEDNYFRKKSAVGSLVKAFDPELIGGCVPEGCNFGVWHCENYTGSPKDYTPIEDYIKVLVANTTVVCTPVKDCSNVKYNIEYHVYQNGVEVSEVYANNGQDRVSVDDLKPDTYSPGDEPVAYPVVSWPDCRFTGWYENPEFTGATVTHTPALASDEEGEDIDLYGQMICEDVCNEPGHEHWFHIGNNPNDKVCLYEKRPTTLTPAVRVKGKAAEPYYMMLSTDPDMVIHEGSEKSMRIQHKNGTVYNVCDKSSCPELAK